MIFFYICMWQKQIPNNGKWKTQNINLFEYWRIFVGFLFFFACSKTYNREHGHRAMWQICLYGLHVTTACPDLSEYHVVFGCPLPIDYLAGREMWEGGGSVGVGLRERVQWRFSWLWQAVDSWTTSSSFSSQRGWNFSHWKSRVINDWGSQNNPSVCFFCFPPFPYFSCPSSFSLAWARLRQALVW